MRDHKKLKISSLFLLFSIGLLAQEAISEEIPAVSTGLWGSLTTPEKVLVGFIIVTIILAVNALVYLNNNLMHIQKMRILEKYAPEQLQALGIEQPVIQQEPFWRRMYKKWTNVVPIEKEADIMLDHDYDGIRELDNSLPPWWLATFYAAVIFAPIYIWFVHFSPYGQSNTEQYAAEMIRADEEVAAYLAKQANTVDETTVFVLNDAESLSRGQFIYKNKCVACHGQQGEGSIGPNFTDQYWIHGGSINDLFTVIKYGVVEQGMQAWRKELRPVQMQEVASYILSLEGTNPPNQKEAQGELYIPPPVEEESDSLEVQESLSMASPTSN